MIVTTSAWRDPFAGSEAENAGYFDEHGRPVLFDVSGEEPYRAMLDEPVRAILPLTNRSEVLIDIQIDVASTVVNVFVDADELRLTVGDDQRPRW